MIKSLMVLAAGLGARMSPMTTTMPKSLALIQNKPILWHVLEFAIQYGKFEKIVINTHYLAELINDSVENFKKLYNPHCEIITVYETSLLETGGAIKNAYKYFAGEEAIFTTNGDAFCINSSANIYNMMQAKWRSDMMDCLLLLSKQNDVIGQTADDYAMINDDGELVAKKAPNAPQNDLFYTYTGCQITKPSLFLSYHEDVFPIYNVQATSRCFGLINEGQFCHVNNPSHLKAVENILTKQSKLTKDIEYI